MKNWDYKKSSARVFIFYFFWRENFNLGFGMDERGPYKDIHLLCFNSRLRGVLNIREDISVFSHFTANMWRQVDEFRIEHNDRENSFEFKITQS